MRNAYGLGESSPTTRTAPYRYSIGRAVAFPDVLVDENRLGPEAPRDLIVDSGDLATVVRALHRAWGASTSASGDQAIKALIAVLRPPVELSKPGLVGAMRAEQEELSG